MIPVNRPFMSEIRIPGRLLVRWSAPEPDGVPQFAVSVPDFLYVRTRQDRVCGFL